MEPTVSPAWTTWIVMLDITSFGDYAGRGGNMRCPLEGVGKYDGRDGCLTEHIWKNCDALSERRNLIQRFVDIFRRARRVKTAEIVDRDVENR